MDASIIIPARNEAQNIGTCLDAVFSQKTLRKFEIIVIDSGSTDKTVEITSRYPVKLIQINAAEFHHGRTRNLGARNAAGEILVYLSADAFPASDKWLEALLSPFTENDRVAAVYGRQIAKDEARPERVFFMSHRYGSERIVQDLSGNCPQYRLYQFSTVNAAIRRSVWKQEPFPEDLNAYEDFSLAVRLLPQWQIVYEPGAAVRHSHNYTLLYSFKQYFDNGVVYGRRGLWSGRESGDLANVWRDGIKYLSQEFLYLIRVGAALRIPYVVVYEMARYAGLYLGRHEHRVPLSLKRRISSHRLFD